MFLTILENVKFLLCILFFLAGFADGHSQSDTLGENSGITVKWTGARSSDWSDSGNFADGTMPRPLSMVVIPADVPNSPIVNINDTINSLTILPEAWLTIDPGAGFHVSYADSSSLNNYGTLVNNGILGISDDLYNEGKIINNGTIDVFAKGEGSQYFFALVNRDSIVNHEGGVINTYNKSFWNEYVNTILDNRGVININKVKYHSELIVGRSPVICDLCITQNSNVWNKPDGVINVDNVGFIWTHRGGVLKNEGIMNIFKKSSIGINAIASNKLINSGKLYFTKNDFDNFHNIKLVNTGELFEKEDSSLFQFEGMAAKYNLVFSQVRVANDYRLDLVEQEVMNLSYLENTIEFRYADLNHIDNPGDILFKVLLEGYTDKWSEGGYYKYTYLDLPPGDYTFKLMAGYKGVWGEEVLEKKIHIRPPFWKTTWFKTLSGILLLILLYNLYKYHTNSLIEKERERLLAEITGQEKERKRLAVDLHDDFGIRISALKMYMNSIEKIIGDRDEQLAMLSKSAIDIVDDSMQNLRILLTNLSPRTLEEHGFVFAIKELATFINKTNAVHIDVNADENTKTLRRDFSLSLYRVTQELMNNSIKHADCKKISIQLTLENNLLILEYMDNGKGFEIKKNSIKGLGLQNIRNRISLLKGNVDFKTSFDNGVHVKITVPYKN